MGSRKKGHSPKRSDLSIRVSQEVADLLQAYADRLGTTKNAAAVQIIANAMGIRPDGEMPKHDPARPSDRPAAPPGRKQA